MYLSFMGADGLLDDGASCRINATISINPENEFHAHLRSSLASLGSSATINEVIVKLESSINAALDHDSKLSLLSPASSSDEEEEWDDEIIEVYGEGYIYGFSGSQSFLRLVASNEIISDAPTLASLISNVTKLRVDDSLVEIWGEGVFRLVLVGNLETENTSWELLDEDDSEVASGDELGDQLAQYIFKSIAY